MTSAPSCSSSTDIPEPGSYLVGYPVRAKRRGGLGVLQRRALERCERCVERGFAPSNEPEDPVEFLAELHSLVAVEIDVDAAVHLRSAQLDQLADRLVQGRVAGVARRLAD